MKKLSHSILLSSTVALGCLLVAWLSRPFASNDNQISIVAGMVLVLLFAGYRVRNQNRRNGQLAKKIEDALPGQVVCTSNVEHGVEALLHAYRTANLDREGLGKALDFQRQKANTQKQLLDLILNGVDEAIILLSADGRVLDVNTQTERIFGYDREYLANRYPDSPPMIYLLKELHERGWATSMAANGPRVLNRSIRSLGTSRTGHRLNCQVTIQQLDHLNDRIYVVRVRPNRVLHSRVKKRALLSPGVAGSGNKLRQDKKH